MSNIKWTKEEILARILEVVEALQLDRMPTTRECNDYYQDSRMTNAACRRYGWYVLADELGLKNKDSETGFAKKFEKKAREMLMAMGFTVRKMPQNYPYDLLVDDSVKVDVKASKLFRGEQGNYYSFSLDKPYATCDYFLLLTVDDDDETITRRMVVPSCLVMTQSQISVGEHKSKYHQYTNRFDLIEKASDFNTDIKSFAKKQDK